MKRVIWKLRFAYHMLRYTIVSPVHYYRIAESAIESNPESIYKDGPKHYAQEELDNWVY